MQSKQLSERRSEQANGRVSGPVLTPLFLAVLDHCALFIRPLFWQPSSIISPAQLHTHSALSLSLPLSGSDLVSVCVSVYLPVCLTLTVRVCLSFFVCVSAYLSISTFTLFFSHLVYSLFTYNLLPGIIFWEYVHRHCRTQFLSIGM